MGEVCRRLRLQRQPTVSTGSGWQLRIHSPRESNDWPRAAGVVGGSTVPAARVLDAQNSRACS
jgi:hypothetical protein